MLRINGVQSFKESAALIARFDIRLVNRNADQRRARSNSLRLVGHTPCVLFRPGRDLLGKVVVPIGLCVRNVSSLSIVAHCSRGL
jgi:hypothetical protein